MTLSHNRGGMYFRARAIPVNPNTERQGIARENLATAVAAWTNTLTVGERQGWDSYAAATPVTDVLGDQLILSGQQFFTRNTTTRLVAGLPIITTAPITAGLGNTPQWTTDPEIDTGTGLAGSVTVEGAGVTGDLAVYMSEPTPVSRTLAHVKRRFAGIEGPPVADVFTVAMAANLLPYPLVSDLGVRITVAFLGDDGRVSASAFRDLTIIT
jgi:hypothetical protein